MPNPAQRALKEGAIVCLANRTILISRDGTEWPIDDSAAPIRDEDGRIFGAVLVFREIHERKRLEATEAERNRLNALRADVATALASTRTVPEVLMDCCKSLVTHLRAVFARIWTLNATGEMLELQASAGLYTHLDGPHSQVPVGQYKIGRIASSREPHLTNNVQQDVNVSDPQWAAREGMVAFAGYPLIVADRVVGVVAMFSREHLTEDVLAELAPFANSIAQFVDRKTVEEEVRKSKSRLESTLAASEIGSWEEYRVVHPDGTIRWEFGKGKSHFIGQGSDRRLVSFDGTVADVTERKQMENELRRVAADFSESDKRKNEFLAMLAHELRNPLAPISNVLQILELSAHNPDEVKSAAAMMGRHVRHLVRLVDDLLDVSRVYQGKIDLRLERIELSAIIQRTVETSRSAIESGQHQLTVAIPSQPIYLRGDAVRLAQVFSNRLNNSSKYSDPGGTIVLSAQCEQGELIVAVKDTGVDIPAEMLSKVFEIFTQVDRSLERSQGGLGIGLSLVRTLVSLHGGTVEAFSDGTDRGSEFIVRLPLIVEEAKAAVAEPPLAKAGKITSRRVLVVDDNRDSAVSLAMLLKLTGHQTLVAHDGVEAVISAETFRPDVVLLDIGLPKLNGYEVARQIRKQPWGKQMVLMDLTGWGQDEDRQKSKDAGFNGHLVKPIDHSALMKLLADLLPATN